MIAQLADGRRLEFPDGTDPAVVQATVKKVLAAKPVAKVDENPSSMGNLVGAALEPNASLLSGMVATPVAGLAGLAAAAGKATGLSDADPADVVRKTQDTLTYQPRTTGGKNAAAAVGFLPEKFAELTNRAGELAAEGTGSPAAGATLKTILDAAPLLLGAKGKYDSTVLADKASKDLYQSALKPPVDQVRNGNAAKAIETLRSEGVNVTRGGGEKLADRVTGVNDKIVEAIANSNARVDKNAVANRLQDLIRERELQANPTSDVAAITNADLEFRGHPLIPGNDMPVQLAQDIKRGTYKQLRDKYGEMGSADTEAQKTIARGLKEEIANAVPEVAPLNAEESALLNAKNLLDRRVAVAGNANPIGIAHLSPKPSNLVAGLLDRSGLVKSLLARMLNPGDLPVSDASLAAATAPQTFSEDAKRRQAVIDALMGAR